MHISIKNNKRFFPGLGLFYNKSGYQNSYIVNHRSICLEIYISGSFMLIEAI